MNEKKTRSVFKRPEANGSFMRKKLKDFGR